jgi:hypothetical protein
MGWGGGRGRSGVASGRIRAAALALLTLVVEERRELAKEYDQRSEGWPMGIYSFSVQLCLCALLLVHWLGQGIPIVRRAVYELSGMFVMAQLNARRFDKREAR